MGLDADLEPGAVKLDVNKIGDARSAEELGLGALHPLDQAIPELAPQAAQTPKSEGGGRRDDREKSPAPLRCDNLQ